MYETVFPDDSKDGDTACSACITTSDTYKCRLPENARIFSAEIKPIDLALDHIEQPRNTDFIVFPIPSLFFNYFIIAILKTLFFWMSF